MDLETIVQKLKFIGNKLIIKTNAVDCYLFGSILVNPKLANDIDILIIYESKNQLGIIKKEFKSFATNYPLHISYFTFFEEQELNFIQQQKAQIIFNL